MADDGRRLTTTDHSDFHRDTALTIGIVRALLRLLRR